jgi:hypothetical protein
METIEIQKNHIIQEKKLHKDYLQDLAEVETTCHLKSRSLRLK